MTISLPPAMIKQMEQVQKSEHRTLSELVREAWRHYFENRLPVEIPTRSELAAMQEGRAAFKRGEYVTLEQLRHELASSNHATRKKRARKTT